MKIYTCSRGSESAEKLGDAFNKPVVLLKQGKMAEVDDIFINWGCSWLKNPPVMLNNANDINFMRNKIAVLDHLSNTGITTIPYTTQKIVASKWESVVIRELIKSTNSKGISLMAPSKEALPKAKLY